MEQQHTIQRLLQSSFEKNAERVAVSYNGQKITYNQLDDMIEHYAALISQYSQSCKCVAVMLNDSLDMICGILAAVKLGFCFMPVNPEYPDMTVLQMLKSADLVLTDDQSSKKIKDLDGIPKSVNCHKLTTSVRADRKFFMNCSEHSALYIYFTSGTTACPKGIIGRNIGLVHFVKWEIKQFAMNNQFVFSQFTPACHDPFLRDVFTPLALGACIAVPQNHEQLLDSESLKHFINNEQITVIHATPSLFRILLQSETLNSTDFHALRYVFLAGERIDSKLLSKWYNVFGGRIQIVNLYGPTETTLAKLFYMVSPSDVKRMNIPIGQAMKGAQALVLDDHMAICSKGQQGEIYIRTPYRSLGYLNDPQLNAERFIHNPYNLEDKNDLLFKTGDIGRMLPDGNIEYTGRVDRQVKIRGFRVELNSVEAVLAKCAGVTGCAVKAFESENGPLTIVGFYTAENDLSPKRLSEEICKSLPAYMCPSGFVRLDKLPVTANNKLDYKALEMPELFTGEDYVRCETELECKLEQLWCSILGKKRFSATGDFLTGGGNSLNIMLMINKVEQLFGYELSMVKVFSGITIRELAKLIEQQRDSMRTNTMLDVEDMIIEYTQSDARYVKVNTSNGSINVLFAEKKPDEKLLQMIREKYNSAVHPNYIEPFCDSAVVLPDEISVDDKEIRPLLHFTDEYEEQRILDEINHLIASNNMISKQITSSNIVGKHALSTAQYIRKHIPENNGILVSFIGLLDIEALNSAMNAVVKQEPLLRSVMQHGNHWIQYDNIPHFNIPTLDISMYSTACQDKIMNEVVLPKFYHVGYKTNGIIQWRAAFIRFNYSSTILCFSANHIIFDGFSCKIFETEIKELYNKMLIGDPILPGKHITYYEYFDNIIRNNQEDAELFSLIVEFTSLSKKIRNSFTKNNTVVQSIDIKLQQLISVNDGVAADELIARVSFEIFIKYCCQLFHVDKIPFVTISSGRHIGTESCYDSIGEFIDYIPFIASNQLENEYTRYFEFINRVENSGINVLESCSRKSKNSFVGKRMMIDFMRNIPIVYNYQSYHVRLNEVKYQRDIWNANVNYINFVVRPETDSAKIIVTTPLKLDSFEHLAQQVCSEFQLNNNTANIKPAPYDLN